MDKYVVYYESAHYAGAGEYFEVEAGSESAAIEITSLWAEDYFYEQDYDYLVEDYGADADAMSPYSTIMWCKLSSQVEY